MARTFALISQVWRVLQQVSCRSETVSNAPKWKGRHQNMRLGSNSMDQEHSLWKNLTRHHGTNFCINWTSLVRFRAIAKRSQMHPNGKKRMKTWAQGPIVWIGSVSFEKFWRDFVARTFALIAPCWHILHRVLCSRKRSQMHPNGKKRTKTWV